MRRLAAVAVALCAAGLVAVPAQPAAASVFRSPGLIAGPRLDAQGLLWGRPGGLVLTGWQGAPRPAASHAQLWLTSAAGPWIATGKAGSLRAGRLGGRLRLLRWATPCHPPYHKPFFAVTGHQLLVAVPTTCGGSPGTHGSELVSYDFATGTRRPVAALGADVAAVSADGSWVAVTYLPPGPRVPAVRVLNLARGTGYTVAGLTAPVDLAGADVDSSGDVVVTDEIAVPPAPQEKAGWATPFARRIHPLGYIVAGTASISSRRVTFAAAAGRGANPYAEAEAIKLVDLRRRGSRIVARFPGHASVIGLDVRGDRIAWSYQTSVAWATARPGRPGRSRHRCRTVKVGPARIETLRLGRIRQPIVIRGERARPKTGGPCMPPPEPVGERL